MKDRIIKQIKQILANEAIIKNAKHVGKAFGFSLVVALVAVIMTNLLYQEKTLLKRGYEVEIVAKQPKTSKNIGGVAVGSLPDLKGSITVNIEDLIQMADANIKKGKKVFKKCAACHTVQKGGPNRIGPNLYKIIGKNKAGAAGFKYSNAMKAKGGKWSIKELNKLLTKPKDFVPGTKMTFAGLKKDKDRANVIAYLISESKK